MIVLTLRPMFSLPISTTYRQVSYLLADNLVSILKVAIWSKFVHKKAFMPIAFCLGVLSSFAYSKDEVERPKTPWAVAHGIWERKNGNLACSLFPIDQIKGRFLLCSFFAIGPSQLAATLPVNQCKILWYNLSHTLTLKTTILQMLEKSIYHWSR